MIKKSFLCLLGLAAVLSAFFAFYAYSWLGSIGNPRDAFAGYEYYRQIGWMFLWPAAAVLAAVGTAVLWTTRSAWALWASFAYFAFFVLTGFYVVDRAGAAFRRSIDPSAPDYDLSLVLGAVIVIVAAIAIYFLQFLVLRLLDRMYPSATETDAEAPSETDPE